MNVHRGRASGAKASRPKLDLVLTILREGDTLVVTRIDRLGRSVLHLITLGAQLWRAAARARRGAARARAGHRYRHRRGPGGRLQAVLAELQRELLVANTRDGLAAARARAATADGTRRS